MTGAKNELRIESRSRMLLGTSGGVATVVAAALPILLGSLGFAIDSGRLAIESTHMQVLADAAALAGTQQVTGEDDDDYPDRGDGNSNGNGNGSGRECDGSNGSSGNTGNDGIEDDCRQGPARGNSSDAVINAVYSVLEANIGVAGRSVVAESAIVTGRYNIATKTFTPGGSGANAVRILAGRIEANSNAFPLVFGRIIGIESMDISSAATALGGSSCVFNPDFSLISAAKPTRAAVVTMGQPVNGVQSYLMTTDGYPIIRVDSSVAADIVISVSGRPDQTVRVPGQGSFWHRLSTVGTFAAVDPRPGVTSTVTLVTRVISSNPNQTRSGGTATWNNVARKVDKLPGTEICVPGTENSAPRLVG